MKANNDLKQTILEIYNTNSDNELLDIANDSQYQYELNERLAAILLINATQKRQNAAAFYILKVLLEGEK